jgi:hypothetical protein
VAWANGFGKGRTGIVAAYGLRVRFSQFEADSVSLAGKNAVVLEGEHGLSRAKRGEI